MPFDGIAIAVVSKELKSIINSRVMKIYQPDKYTLVFHLRVPGENSKLLISIDPAYPRIHTTEADFHNPASPPAFCMLLRKHLEPSRIIGISQVAYERIIKIDFEAFDESIGAVEKSLYFELMGRHSNLILTQGDQVIDAIHRIYDEERPRQLFPGAEYQLPPDQGKLNPLSVDKEGFLDTIRLLPGNLSLQDGLAHSFQGLSKQAAKEILLRAALDPKQPKIETSSTDWQKLWEAFAQFFCDVTAGGTPTYINKGGREDFTAYSLTNESGVKFSSLNNLLDKFYTNRINKERVRQLASKLSKAVTGHLDRVIKKQKIQEATLEDAKQADEWKRLGELITANLYHIQKGDTEVRVIDYYSPDQPEISIKLDPTYSPQKNAQRYFKKYHKAKTSKKITGEQLKKTKAERRYLEEVLTHINLADSVEDLREIEAELTKFDYLKKPATKNKLKHQENKSRGPKEYISVDGLTILVGRNNQQNDQLTFKIARPDDVWLHAQNIPGSHVVIRSEGQIPDSTLEEAATLAAYYSKAKTSPKVPVDYTTRKHVRKPTGARPGFVLYDHFETLLADPTREEKLPKKKRP